MKTFVLTCCNGATPTDNDAATKSSNKRRTVAAHITELTTGVGPPETRPPCAGYWDGVDVLL